MILESRLLEEWYRDEDECGACLLILEKQQTAKSKERIDKLAAAQTAVNPFFNAIYCFSSMSNHAPHSSSFLYHSSNMKLLQAHIFCFLFIEKDRLLR